MKNFTTINNFGTNKLRLIALWSIMGLFLLPTTSSAQNDYEPYLQFNIKNISQCKEIECLEQLDPNDPESEFPDKEIIFTIDFKNMFVMDIDYLFFTAQFIGMPEYTEIWFLEIENVKDEQIFVNPTDDPQIYEVMIQFNKNAGLPADETFRVLALADHAPITTKRMASTKTQNYGKTLGEGECYRINVLSASQQVGDHLYELKAKGDQQGTCSIINGLESSASALGNPVKAIYPNPTSHNLFIDVYQAQATAYQVIDIYGRILLEGESIPQNQTLIIPVEQLSHGNYLVKITQNKKKHIAHVVLTE